MSKVANPHTRHRVARHPGIYYRERKDGSRSYCFSYRQHPGAGVQFKTVKGGLAEAVAARADYVSKINRGEQVLPVRSTFAELAEAFMHLQRNRLKPRTIELHELELRRRLLPAFGERRVHTITTDDVAAYIAQLQAQGLAGETINNALAPLNGIMRYAVRKKLMAANPVAGLDPSERPLIERKPKRVLSPEEMQQLVDAATPASRLLVQTVLATGLRQAEALGLAWRDVDFEANEIHVTGQLLRTGVRASYGKTDAALRRIAVPPSLRSALAKHKLASRHSGPDDFVFSTRTGTAISHRNALRAVQRASKAAGLNEPHKAKLNFHSLRHTFGSVLIASGADVADVSRQMGHSRISVTLDVYAHEWRAAGQAERTRAIAEQRFAALFV